MMFEESTYIVNPDEVVYSWDKMVLRKIEEKTMLGERFRCENCGRIIALSGRKYGKGKGRVHVQLLCDACRKILVKKFSLRREDNK